VFTRKVLERLQAEMNQIRAIFGMLAGNQKTVNGYLSTGYELCDNVMLKMNN
jgi:predicted patatin/cPLA2 family phospholipase